ncbi:MAG: response regulator transcription factor, partial [Gemmatimonadaceae bacterium]
RIATSLHPRTALSLGERAIRDVTAALESALRQELSCTIGLLRLAAIDSVSTDLMTWDAEVRRVADALAAHTAVVGYDDARTLIFSIQREPAECFQILSGIYAQRDSDALYWHTALIGARDLTARDLIALRTAAADVLSTNRRATDAPVVLWRPNRAGVSPDVVLVEGDATLRDMIAFALGERGISYEMFADGAAALQALMALRPAPRRPIVLLDVELPGIDGHSLFEELRHQRPGAFDFVFATARATEADQLRALSAGALDYIRKPLNVKLLMAKLEHWLERAPATR